MRSRHDCFVTRARPRDMGNQAQQSRVCGLSAGRTKRVPTRRTPQKSENQKAMFIYIENAPSYCVVCRYFSFSPIRFTRRRSAISLCHEACLSILGVGVETVERRVETCSKLPMRRPNEEVDKRNAESSIQENVAKGNARLQRCQAINSCDALLPQDVDVASGWLAGPPACFLSSHSGLVLFGRY